MTATFAANPLKLLASGVSLPGNPVSNEQLITHLATHVSAKQARIARLLASRLGINSRHVSRDLTLKRAGTRSGFHSRNLCSKAVLDACASANIEPVQLGYLIGHTTTPYSLLPANIAWVAEDLQFQGPYLELRQACTGFASALHIAAAMIGSGTCECISIVGSETGSAHFAIEDKFLTNEQLINFVQMGDGAGAVIVRPDDASEKNIISDIFAGHIGSQSPPGFYLAGGGSADPHCESGFPAFMHNAKAVLEKGPGLFHAGVKAITNRGYKLEDFDWIIPHQANGKLAQAFSKEFNLDPNKIFVTADTLGNLGSAAIWVSFNKLLRSGKLQHGSQVLVLGAEASKYQYGGFVYTH